MFKQYCLENGDMHVVKILIASLSEVCDVTQTGMTVHVTLFKTVV
jgi:hypothetical protein